jgi:hypothetical protein
VSALPEESPDEEEDPDEELEDELELEESSLSLPQGYK